MRWTLVDSGASKFGPHKTRVSNKAWSEEEKYWNQKKRTVHKISFCE
jgi:hypothetical protein